MSSYLTDITAASEKPVNWSLMSCVFVAHVDLI